jgi:hypothetical protein
MYKLQEAGNTRIPTAFQPNDKHNFKGIEKKQRQQFSVCQHTGHAA